MKVYNAGIVGCGAIFENHAKGILDTENANILAICDTNSEKLKEKAERYNCLAYNNYDELLENENIDV
ncbi:Gfo/Idh/MocA family oxidoreductase, partial [Cutibacterium acnes]